ncbi:hypothetical protein CK203_003917 [Vitis vinifera]|uniref:Tf2-1-like SH3-like domain-containing protein n=1 Tax=Vitis vinifera TaxID=29760 RepID=A0A438KA51_VITVI|nr:hypothetical protein CK203_003917 [Vitis vinifera]
MSRISHSGVLCICKVSLNSLLALNVSHAAAHSLSVWDDITMDFIEGLPPSRGKNTIFEFTSNHENGTPFFPGQSFGTLGSSPVNEVDQNLASRNDLLNKLKLNLHQASNRVEQIADSKRRDIEFNEGDLVFLKLHPCRQQIVFKRASQKLAYRFYGPFPIEKRIVKIGDSSAGCPTLPPLTDDGALIIEPAEIIDTRWLKKLGKFFEECLVKWKHLSVEDAT